MNTNKIIEKAKESYDRYLLNMQRKLLIRCWLIMKKRITEF